MGIRPAKYKGVISNMGLTHVGVTLKSLTSPETYTADFLVDTGAWDSLVPASTLRKIGIKPVGIKNCELATGEGLDFEFAYAEVSFLGEIAVTLVLFGPDEAEPILGVTALEMAGFIVDPKNESLRKLKARPLKAVTLKSVA